MMRKKILKIAFFTLMVAGILYACNQEFDEPDGNLQQLTIAEARAWYEAHKPGNIDPIVIGLKSGGTETKVKQLKPDWNNTVKFESEMEEVVEVALLAQGGMGFATAEAYQAWNSTSNRGYMASMTKLVVLKNKTTREMVSFIMTLVGDANYLEKSKFDIRKNNYLHKEKEFNGLVFFHNLDGDIANGWQFTNGKATHTLQLHFANVFNFKLKTASSECTTINIYGWYQDYVTWYQIASGTVTYHEEAVGAPYRVLQSSATVCVSSAGGGGGGSAGGYLEATQQVALSEPIKKIFVNGTSNLSATDIGNMNKAFDEMNYDCIFNYISNQVSSRNIVLGEVNINSSMIGVAGLNSLGNLSFGGSDLITQENLSHEWFHLAQWKIRNVDIFSASNQGLAEFENALFADIRETIKVEGNFEQSYHTFACYGGNNEDYKVQYQNWLKSLTSSGTGYPTAINSNAFNNWANVFGDVSPYSKSRGFQYDNSSYYPHTMFLLFNNCKIIY